MKKLILFLIIGLFLISIVFAKTSDYAEMEFKIKVENATANNVEHPVCDWKVILSEKSGELNKDSEYDDEDWYSDVAEEGSDIYFNTKKIIENDDKTIYLNIRKTFDCGTIGCEGAGVDEDIVAGMVGNISETLKTFKECWDKYDVKNAAWSAMVTEKDNQVEWRKFYENKSNLYDSEKEKADSCIKERDQLREDLNTCIADKAKKEKGDWGIWGYILCVIGGGGAVYALSKKKEPKMPEFAQFGHT